MPFNVDQITETEFAVALRGGDAPCYLVPVAPEVRTMLQEMLTETIGEMESIGGLEDIDYGEEYGNRVSLQCPIDDPTVAHVVELFNAQNMPLAAAALDDPSCIDFYFARFTDQAGGRCLAVKTPSQFKATIGKKLIRILDDTLVVVEDKIFKLDNRFDFIVFDDRVAILNPKQFMRVAEVEQILADMAPQHVNEIAQAMDIVDFEPILEYVQRRKRAQKLVSSIRKRPTLGQITLPMLQEVCNRNNIPMTEQNGKLVPENGHEMDFLELLDGRRYPYPLEEEDPELLRALRRKKV